MHEIYKRSLFFFCAFGAFRSGTQSVFALVFLLLFLPPASAGNAPGNPAAEIRALTGAPARIVWRQQADAADDHFRLMGFDTEDGRGERALRPDLSEYDRPLLTPRGDRVIFSNRRENTIYIVNWDGSGRRRLGNGFAVAVWQDPTNGTEWVYGAGPVPNADTFFPVQRAPIDRPDQIETVWSQTLIHPDNFQLSADGQRACANMPWPICGVIELPERGWKKYGDGCWPSLAPENIPLFWIFDGAHRNLTICRTDTDERWTVNINRAPGIAGFEVYHPRWSNRARILCMTGPYKIGSGDNRIRGGGPEVEVYLGRFDETYRAIEGWVRVTYNTFPDFSPDVWVRPSAGAGTNLSAAAGAGKKATWPANNSGLVFLWQDRTGKNEIERTAGAANPASRVEPKGAARYGRHFEMDLTHGMFSVEPGATELILKACRASGQFSLAAVLAPRRAPRDFTPIISFASSNSVNFILGQEQDRLIFRLPDAGGKTADLPLCVLATNAPQQATVSYTPDRLACFLDGKQVLATNAPPGGPAGWSAGQLAFGDQTNFWPGRLDHIALYSRALDPEEIRRNHQALAGELRRRAPAPQLVIAGRLKEPAAIPDPAAIAPYRRALTVNLYDELKPLQGAYAAPRIMVAHWVIMDGQVLAGARREKDKTYRLVLEPFEQHPELEGERLIMDSEDYSLPIYYETE